MYFQRPTEAEGALVSKTTSRELGASTANRLVAVSAVRGEGAKASSSGLVSVSVPSRLTITKILRLPFFFFCFTSVTHRGVAADPWPQMSDNTVRIASVYIIYTAGAGLARNSDFSVKSDRREWNRFRL